MNKCFHCYSSKETKVYAEVLISP